MQTNLDQLKSDTSPVLQNTDASAWALQDRFLVVEFHTKMNAMSGQIFELLLEGIDLVSADYEALLLYNEGRAFCAGANLQLFANWIKAERWDELDAFLQKGQQTYMALKHAPFPVVAGAHGFALGGGCELLLHCDAVVADPGLKMGLVELGVGVIPAWGGCKEMLLKKAGSDTAVEESFKLISSATMTGGANDAIQLGYLSGSDRIVVADRLVETIRMAENLMPGYQAPGLQQIDFESGQHCQPLYDQIEARLANAEITAHTALIQNALAGVLCGNGKRLADEWDLLMSEREVFMQLAQEPLSLDRIEYMLENGRRLDN